MALVPGQSAYGFKKTGGQFPAITLQTDDPGADERVRVCEQFSGVRGIKSAGLMQRPKAVQRRLTRLGSNLFSQRDVSRRIGALAKEPNGGLSVPLVRVIENLPELIVCFFVEARVGVALFAIRAEPVNAAGGGVDLALVMLAVRDVALVKIGNQHRAIRGVDHVDRAEGYVGILHRKSEVARGE